MKKRTRATRAAACAALTACIVLPLLGTPAFRAAAGGVTSRASQQQRPVRRALLVGIGQYSLPAGFAPFNNLDGPVPDVKALESLLLTPKYGFSRQNVRVLLDKQATRERIMREMEEHLVNGAEAGDVSLFYYAGHGSQVTNRRAERDKLDETIIPVDAVRPVATRAQLKDIRDKELAALYHKAIDRGVVFTVIQDSCFSGSGTRGGLGTEKVREVNGVALDFDEPAATVNGKSPDEREGGLLSLSASQDFETAKERFYPGGRNPGAHGDFTHALLQVLYETPADDVSAEELFQRVATRLKADGRQQHPVIAGHAARQKQTIFGGTPPPAPPGARVTAIVGAQGKITLQGGLDVGLQEGCELRGVGNEAGSAVRLRVTAPVGMGTSAAAVIAGDPKSIRSGDVFIQDKWATPGEPNLTVWVPPSRLSRAAILAAAAEFAKLKESSLVELVEDPTEETAAQSITYGRNGWQLRSPGRVTELGTNPSAGAVLKILASESPGARSRLFVSLPPAAELARSVRLGEGTEMSSVGIAATPEAAHYVLVGRSRASGGSEPEYSWVLPAATEGQAGGAAPTGVEPLALPPRTDFVVADGRDEKGFHAAADKLETLALKLARLRGWLKLPSSENAKNKSFPFRLVVKDAETGAELGRTQALVEGKIYGLALAADPQDLQGNTLLRRRYVYVFNIDKAGASTLLFPSEAGVGNLLPTDATQTSIQLGDPRLFVIGGEIGTETYVMLATDEKIINPGVFAVEGVRTSRTRGGGTELEQLLEGLTVSTRTSNPIPVPQMWSVYRVTHRSIHK